MTVDIINAITAVATLVLLAATAVAGFLQLRHLRAGNDLAAVQAIERDFRTPDVQAAFNYVQAELATRMADPAYRAELEAPGYIDPRAHPEMLLCNWLNRTGTLIRAGLLKETLFMDAFAPLVVYYWALLVPAIAVLRRTRGPNQYGGFEYLAARAQLREQQRKTRTIEPGSSLLHDPWLEEDRRP